MKLGPTQYFWLKKDLCQKIFLAPKKIGIPKEFWILKKFEPRKILSPKTFSKLLLNKSRSFKKRFPFPCLFRAIKDFLCNWHEPSAFQRSAFVRSTAGNDVVATILYSILHSILGSILGSIYDSIFGLILVSILG